MMPPQKEKIIHVEIAGETLKLIAPQRDTGDLYWHMLWPAAIGLAEHLVKMGPGQLAGKRVLELGCGLGLVGIIAARQGADVTLSDIDDDALETTRKNLALNDAAHVKTEVIDWRSPPPLEPYRYVIGSDLIFDSRILEPLLRTVDALLDTDGEIIFADPIRTPFTAFLVYAHAHNFEHGQSLVDIPSGRQTHRIGVYDIRRCKKKRRKRPPIHRKND